MKVLLIHKALASKEKKRVAVESSEAQRETETERTRDTKH